jgi:glucosamine-6-phosphate deaminase
MRIVIQPDYERVSLWTAAYVAKRVRDFAPTARKPFVLGLPTGSSPVGTYRELVRLHREGKLSFRHVVTFNMDEYVGLPEDSSDSYHAFMRRHLFDHVDIPRSSIHIPDGLAKDPELECRRYEEAMARIGGVELFLGGIGVDGHIAFNEPGSSLASRTRVKTLTADTIEANARFFDNDPSRVPRTALTVGVGTVLDAREVLILISGRAKARALAHVVEGGINHMWTVSALQLHPNGLIVCDEDACDELKVATFRYFKDIEAPYLDPKSVFPEL